MTDDSPSYEDLAREIRTNMSEDGDPASERYTSLLRNLSEVERLKKEARIKSESTRTWLSAREGPSQGSSSSFVRRSGRCSPARRSA